MHAEKNSQIKARCFENIQHICNRKLDIVDNVLKKLEKHAENLEVMVSRRTAELEGEKQKTDLLLYRMLPKSVDKIVICHKSVTFKTIY